MRLDCFHPGIRSHSTTNGKIQPDDTVYVSSMSKFHKPFPMVPIPMTTCDLEQLKGVLCQLTFCFIVHVQNLHSLHYGCLCFSSVCSGVSLSTFITIVDIGMIIVINVTMLLVCTVTLVIRWMYYGLFSSS